ncbi:MAG: alpha-amylase family glycosyl hydrolase [Muricoprocola sp.]
MAWYDEAIFYHIYPLGLTGAPKQNSYGEPEHRLNQLLPWISHIKEIGCNAIYIGPLFESVGHGYETTDYKKLDSRLGTNDDLTNFVKECHKQEIRVIFDGVFNHTGRDFFAFKDIQQYREGSSKKDWYCNVNFSGNNEYNDGFSYENWGGYNLLVKLNQKNPEVQNYICDVIRFWVDEFDVDGIRLDAADVLDFDFMRKLRKVANTVKPDFWLMGEVIHGDYARWANADTLHSVTNYHLHKALYSGHNDHNYFEIAHTVRRLNDLGNGHGGSLKLYNFIDNHDVERIYTKLNKKEHFIPTHVLLYTLPGIPSIYYGSEFGIEGRKERFSDDSLRPYIDLNDHKDDIKNNWCTKVIAKLGKAHQKLPALSYGNYTEHLLTNRQYAFSRNAEGQNVIVTVNNDDNESRMHIPANGVKEYVGVLSGQKVHAEGGMLNVTIPGNYGEVWMPADSVKSESVEEIVLPVKEEPVSEPESEEITEEILEEPVVVPSIPEQKDVPSGRILDAVPMPENKPYEEMTIEELHKIIYEKMKKNGPVTDRMYQDIIENVHQPSLAGWAKTFR